MSRISFSEVNAMPDALDQVAFELILPTLPGAGNSRHLTIKCQSVSQPGSSTESFEVGVHGHVKRFRGRKMYPRSLSATFYEDSTFATVNTLRRWLEFIAGTESGNSQGYQADYSVDAVLVTYDTIGRAINRTIYEHLFIQDIPDLNMDGNSSASVPVSVTFSYDRIVSNGHPLL